MSSESANISNIPDATIKTWYKDGEKRWLVLERETNWEQIDLILSPIARIPCSTYSHKWQWRIRQQWKIWRSWRNRNNCEVSKQMREVCNADANDLEEGAGSNEQGIATVIIYVQMSIYRINVVYYWKYSPYMKWVLKECENGLHKYLKNELCASKSNELHNNNKNR